jgi:hypothetical protein
MTLTPTPKANEMVLARATSFQELGPSGVETGPRLYHVERETGMPERAQLVSEFCFANNVRSAIRNPLELSLCLTELCARTRFRECQLVKSQPHRRS